MPTYVLLIVAAVLMLYAAYELLPRSSVLIPRRPLRGMSLNAAPAARGGLSTALGPGTVRAFTASYVIPRAQLIVIALSVLAVGAWVVLYQWYSLPDHASSPVFAFDKIPDHFDSAILRYTTLLFLAVALIYAVNYWLIKQMPAITRPVRIAFIALVAGAGLVNIFLYPVGALDVFNYITKLKIAFYYHQDPYLVTFGQVSGQDPFAPFAFLGDIPLFYGPAWLVISGVPALFSGFGDVIHVLVALKVFNVVLLVLTAVALYQYQDDDKSGWLAAYLFLANPLVLFEGIGNAHNDVMMGLFLIAALLALKRQSVLAGPLLMLSVLVKFFTVALIPLFLLAMVVQRWRREQVLNTALLSVAAVILAFVVVAVAFEPRWSFGPMLQGLWNGVQSSQDMSSTSVYSLAREYMQQQGASDAAVSSLRSVFVVLFGVCALAMLVWTWRRNRPVVAAMIDTFLLFSVLLSLLYPWYLIPALAMLALRRSMLGLAFMFVATTLGLLYHPLSVWAWFNSSMSAFQIHLFQAMFLTLPVIAFLALELSRLAIRRAPVAGSQ